MPHCLPRLGLCLDSGLLALPSFTWAQATGRESVGGRSDSEAWSLQTSALASCMPCGTSTLQPSQRGLPRSALNLGVSLCPACLASIGMSAAHTAPSAGRAEVDELRNAAETELQRAMLRVILQRFELGMKCDGIS